MAGLLDFEDPQRAGLMGIAQGLLASAGPSRMPVSLGQAFAAAAGQGQDQYQKALQAKRLQELQQLQMQIGQQGLQKGGLELDVLRRRIAQNAAYDKAFAEQAEQEQSSAPYGGGYAPAVNQAFGGSLPQPTQLPQSRPMSNIADRMMAAALKSGDYETYHKAYQLKLEEKKLAPKYSTDFRQAVDPQTGRLTNYVLGDDGSYRALPMGVKPDISIQNLGGYDMAVDKNALIGGQTFRRTMTPDAAASNALGWANHNQSVRQFAISNDPAHQAALEQARAGAKEAGTTQAKARTNLPDTIAKAEQAISNIDALVGRQNAAGQSTAPHPGFASAVGAALIPGLKYVPGSDVADFNKRLEQIKGGAFLEAYNTLKGGGQITEIEGQKATQAITRMDTAQSEKEFVSAAREFQDVLRKGIARAKMQASGTSQFAPIVDFSQLSRAGGARVIDFSQLPK